MHKTPVGLNCIKIDRSTKWGNPFVIGRDGNREEVIAKHKIWFLAEIKAGRIKMRDLAKLYGHDLACWCAPLACHGDLLEKAAMAAFHHLANKEAP
jgi:hypothetical protein